MPSVGSIFASYNALIDRARACEDLEALVLVHQDAEIVDADFCERRPRRARRTRPWASSAAWGRSACAASPGGRARSRSPRSSTATTSTAAAICRRSRGRGTGRRRTPASARSTRSTASCSCSRRGRCENLRFDESLGQFHGYDFDFCLQVRAAGRKAVTADFRAIHHHALEPFDDPEPWIAAHIRMAEKWDGRIPGVGTGPGTWEERALRAEAERDAARVHRPRQRAPVRGPARRSSSTGWQEMRSQHLVAARPRRLRRLGSRAAR